MVEGCGQEAPVSDMLNRGAVERVHTAEIFFAHFVRMGVHLHVCAVVVRNLFVRGLSKTRISAPELQVEPPLAQSGGLSAAENLTHWNIT